MVSNIEINGSSRLFMDEGKFGIKSQNLYLFLIIQIPELREHWTKLRSKYNEQDALIGKRFSDNENVRVVKINLDCFSFCSICDK